MNIAELFTANLARGPDRPMLREGGRWLRAAEVSERASRLAGVLQSWGVTPGDRVAVVLPNGVDVVAAIDGIARLGAVSVPVLASQTPGEVAAICADAEAAAVVTSVELVGSVSGLRRQLPRPPRVLVLGTADADELLDRQPGAPDVVERRADDLAVLAYTSGTTGRAKGVMLTHGNLRAQVDGFGAALSLTPDDVGLLVLPLAHLYGFAQVLAAAHFGVAAVVQRWFTPDGFLRAVAEHGVTATAVVPTMLPILLDHPRFAASDLSILSWMVVGAAPLPPPLAERWQAATGVLLLQGYGLTETAGGVTVQRPGESSVGACGPPYPGCELVAVSSTLEPLASGEVGELCVQGPLVTPGYWRDAVLSQEALVPLEGRQGRWLRTGDLGCIERDGSVTVTERVKDLIIRDGLNVYPRDVEDVLLSHADVAEAAVIGRADERVGERVVACVVLRPGAQADAEGLRAHCASQLAGYKIPEIVHVLEDLPKSPIGKVSKHDLRVLVRES